jgi:hypothetical protein
MTLRAHSQLTGINVKVLRSYLMLPSNEALPCYRLPRGKTIVVRRSDFEFGSSGSARSGDPTSIGSSSPAGCVKPTF